MGMALGLPRAWATPTHTTTTLTVTSSGSAVTSVTSGTVVTLTATVVSGSTPVSPGQVKFCDAAAAHCEDAALLATAQLTTAGVATCKFRPGPGGHSYQAIFVGTTSYAKSSSAASSLTVSLAKYPTAVVLASSGSIGNYTLTATLAGLGSKTLAPSGSISFLDTTNGNSSFGTVPLGAATLTQGFVTASTSNLSAGPTSGLATGDFNGDGILDLVGPVPSTNSVALSLGNSDGSFSTPAFVDAGTSGLLAVGDFNGDGALDVAIVNPGTCHGGSTSGCSLGSVNVLVGNGDGTFNEKSSDGLGTGSQVIAVADFNGDGILDIVSISCGAMCGDPGDIVITTLLGNGDATFTNAKSTTIPGAGLWAPVSVGDFNGDGIPDLILSSLIIGPELVFLGNGDGTFTQTSTLTLPVTYASVNSATLGDFNGDGIADVAFAEMNYNSSIAFSSTGVVVYLGNGDGTFTLKYKTLVGATPGLNSIAVGDFNNDGISDLVTSDSSGVITVLQGKGNGTFSVSTVNVPDEPGSVVVGDFNGDGLQDLALNTSGNDTWTIMLKQIAETATATLNHVSVSGAEVHEVEASYPGDANHTPGASSTVPLLAAKVVTTLALSSSASSFTAGTQITLTATLSPPSVQTYVTDGEIVTFYFKGASIGTSPLSGGVATLSTSSLPAGADSLTASYPGDANFDGATSGPLALTVAQVMTTLRLTTSTIANPPFGNQLVLTANLIPYTSGPFTTGGDPVIFYNGGKKIGTGALSSGVATLTINPLPAGSYTLQASYPGDVNFVASQSPASTLTATTLQVTVSPGSSVYGNNVTITATLTPASAGSATTDYEQVTFYNGPFSIGTGALISGVATLDITSLPAGSNTITAVYLGDSTFLGASNAAVARVSTVSGSVQTYVVATTADSSGIGGVPANCTGSVNPNCSLRDALAAAAADGAGNITFATPLFATPQTITLTSIGLFIPSSTAIIGPAAGLTVYGAAAGQYQWSVFNVNNAVLNASISNLTITGNTLYMYAGGGINNDGQLTVSNSSITGNAVVNLLGFSTGGAGIANSGIMTIRNSTVSGNLMYGNRESGSGGGIANVGTLTVINSSISGNDVSCEGGCGNIGGGIANDGTLILMGSTVQGNTAARAGYGSGIINLGVMVASSTSVINNFAWGSLEDDCDGYACPVNGVNGNTTGAPQPTQPAAAIPQLSPSGGTFAGLQSVTITDTTPGAVIFYTNNANPVWTRYYGPIVVSNTDTLQAIAVASGYTESLIATGTYTAASTVAQPLISPPTGTYTSAQSVTITDTTPGAVIYYTTDGSNPSRSSAVFSGTPFTVSTSQTVKALAVAPGNATSPEGVVTFNIIQPYAATPTFTLPPGFYHTAQMVGLSDVTPGARIYYTTDHSLPTTASMLYTGGSIPITTTTQLKAIAVAPGYSTSTVAVGDFYVSAAQPIISPPSGRYSGAQTVTITSATPGATIFYTTDGSNPNWHSPVFNPASPIIVSSSQIVKALAWAPNYATSPEGVATYTIGP
jgi:Bacterial Ig-like domain (group 3)/Chitobiase/beta-hexosaminidase C-terminal domain/FG-GAP-like repeat